MASAASSTGVGASIMSTNAEIGCPEASADAHCRSSGMPGERILAKRRIETGAPAAMCRPSAFSVRAFCRPYWLTGHNGASVGTQGTRPSNTWFDDKNSTGMPCRSSFSVSATVWPTLT